MIFCIRNSDCGATKQRFEAFLDYLVSNVGKELIVILELYLLPPCNIQTISAFALLKLPKYHHKHRLQDNQCDNCGTTHVLILYKASI